MAEPRVYSCFNFRLRSEIPLFELAVASEDDLRPIVEVRAGSLPAILPGAKPTEHGLQVADGMVMLTVPKTARYLLNDGGEVVVCPLPDARERDVRLFLLGSALAILCYQRGLLPLHANAVVIKGEAMAFAGHPGAGKSTLAAYFHGVGREILCDDVCMIEFDAKGQAFALPGLLRLKLWGDAAAAFGHDSRSLDQVLDGMDKYQIPLPPRVNADPYPLRRLYILDRAGGAGPSSIVRARGSAAMQAVMAQTYRGAYVGPMGLTAAHFCMCLKLLERTQVYTAYRKWGYEVFKQEATHLERHMIGTDD